MADFRGLFKKKGKLPRFYIEGIDTVHTAVHSNDRDWRDPALIWGIGGGAEYSITSERPGWLLDVRLTFALKERFSCFGPKDTWTTWFASLHYKFDPRFKHHFIAPEIGRHCKLVSNALYLSPSVNYYIPVDGSDNGWNNLYLTLKLSITLFDAWNTSKNDRGGSIYNRF